MSQEIVADKSLGQHWLDDEESLNAICKAANLRTNDNILEIGPGKGSLTAKLLASGANVTAVEFDKRLVSGLQSKFKGSNFRLVVQSITKFNLNTMAPDYKVVANIPYYLTGHLLQMLSEATNPPNLAVLLVQKEVAQRVCAEPGESSLLSISTQYYFEVEKGKVVPATLFTPPPKVDSQILILKKRREPLFSKVNEKEFFRIVKAGFSNRRKTLLNSLSGGLRLPKENVALILEKAEINPNNRAQTLNLDQWYNLYSVVLVASSNNT